MTDLTVDSPGIPTMSAAAIDKVCHIESVLMAQPQCKIATHHVLHGGLYARTIRMEAGCVLAGALIKINTTLIISGAVTAYVDGRGVDFFGYNVIPASAGRKQVFYAHIDTDMTMLFPTDAFSVEEAEEEFTDETDALFSRKGDDIDTVIITGE